VTPALAFRAFLGGEARINDYCHGLAVAGGKRMQELFEKETGKAIAIMESEKGELTANLVCQRARLPLCLAEADPTHALP
jgi:hypothetical protein